MAMEDASLPDLEKGTWVQVWAQVSNGQVHPEDYILKFESHNEDFKAHILRSRVTVPNGQPSWVPKCCAMFKDEQSGAHYRCARNDRHDGSHKVNALEWGDKETVGYIEEKS